MLTSTKIASPGEFIPAPGPRTGDLSTGGTLHVRTIAVSLAALALTITITGCSTAAQHGQAPSTSTSAPGATVTPAAGITTAPVTQGCSPAAQGFTIAEADSIVEGNGYSPINSLIGTTEDFDINGGALGQDSTGAEAVLWPPPGDEPAYFAESLNYTAAEHGSSAKAAASTCVYDAAVTVTGSKADVVMLLSEDGIDTEPLSGLVVPATTPAASAPSPSPTTCAVPDIADDSVASASSNVQAAGFHLVIVTKADPNVPANHFPPGFLWGQSPGVQDEPCGSTVTLYVQP
jgi:hypothetical protein